MSSELYAAYLDEPYWGIALGKGMRPLEVFSIDSESSITQAHRPKDPLPTEFHGPVHHCTTVPCNCLLSLPNCGYR